MIERVYLKDMISFEEVSIELNPGLIVFTGPSGAGKSLLMQAILANFGYGVSTAKLCEIEMKKPNSLESEEYILFDPLVIKAIRKERARYYINNQNISHKKLKELLGSSVKYLSIRDRNRLESDEIIDLIDEYIYSIDSKYIDILKRYRDKFRIYIDKKLTLQKRREEEKRVTELIEFTRFEIEKISSINPKVGEYEELLDIKQKLSRVDKIHEAIESASRIFEYEEKISEVFALVDKSGEYFTDAMNQLRIDFDKFKESVDELSEIDIEYVLDRLEKLHYLINRYDSIEGALEYLKKKEKELDDYLHIEQNVTKLNEEIYTLESELLEIAYDISKRRKDASLEMERLVSIEMNRLKLPEISIVFDSDNTITVNGIDRVELRVGDTDISSLSGGEFNRLRLALMSVSAQNSISDGGVIFLDEIDANVSGDESIAIASMITKLAKRYQIFAISHQPHLSSKADCHICVKKDENGISRVSILEKEGRIKEIARIISGEKSDNEAIAFATKLLNEGIESENC